MSYIAVDTRNPLFPSFEVMVVESARVLHLPM